MRDREAEIRTPRIHPVLVTAPHEGSRGPRRARGGGPGPGYGSPWGIERATRRPASCRGTWLRLPMRDREAAARAYAPVGCGRQSAREILSRERRPQAGARELPNRRGATHRGASLEHLVRADARL